MVILSKLGGDTQCSTSVLERVDIKPRQIDITVINNVEYVKLRIKCNQWILLTKHQCNVAAIVHHCVTVGRRG